MAYSLNDDTREEIKEILEDNKYLTSSELAYMLEVAPCSIREWREKLGVECLVKVNTSFMRKWNTGKEYPLIEDPKIWDNKEWFSEQYEEKELGRRVIAKMINKTPLFVLTRLRKYEIQTRDVKEASKSKNPCCTREWLEEHYERQGLSQRKCAKLAGVNPQTIVNWLVKFGMSVRNHSQSLSGERNPSYGRKINTPVNKGSTKWRKPDESNSKKNNKRVE
jgi:DNA-binding transcriptional regulator YiaG